jgi:ABC-type multidrug transport system fused ATPase/permease subunit
VAAEQGTHDQLLAVGTYAELYSVQFNKIPAKAAL